ncbi:metalloregulator ArsR/SmtB family transcription factor [Agromyces seonyuensis]|uniref:Metalloregulator ArsR/SmtB family transcription factor n=1 Tax=Agromyces seonyuensis TaxID=2662446 RepID=A0A6I4NVX6_9MICO|nr:metalloregulator ArsR/SmtB family transcription factor [Agromyces seonyuensis]MWB98500.1 metalloregulator ArsR/SmtB family transcription factor [Agromyces seonyuensis]
MDAVVVPPIAVLADPTRARILRLIRDADEGRAQVGRLAEALGLRQPTVSHHMKALLADGFVARQPEGRVVWYSIAPDRYDRVAALLGGPAAEVEPDLERITADLSVRFRGVFGAETIAAYVAESRDLLAERGAPLLASRTAAFAAGRLESVARTGGEPAAVPGVLFVCVQNAGRSQLAAAILKQLAGERVVVRTAGSEPGTEVRGEIVRALDEIGVGIGGEFPKPLTVDAVRAADVVVTMGCGDACPIYSGRRYLDWDLEDPVGKPPSAVRAIRDDIDRRVRELIAELGI